MMKTIQLLFISLILLSCDSAKPGKGIMNLDVPFIEAKNYFVRNDLADQDQIKFETQQEFDAVFGMATTMGELGKPTPIDFSKQFVIAQIEDPSYETVNLKPISIHKNADIVEVKYRKVIGAQQSYQTQSAMILIIDRKYDGDVNLVEVP